MERHLQNHHPSHLALSIVSFLFLGCYFVFVFIINDIHDDGLTYAILAKNMAQGLGSIWTPSYSPYQYQQFFEHPGLGLWMGSFFFKVFGDHLCTEKIFSSLIAIINIIYLFAYWKHYIAPRYRASVGWMVILSFLLIPLMVFYYPSNVLEMLANTFALPTIHLLLLSIKFSDIRIEKYYYQGIAAFLLTIAFLINGPLTLFPLAFYLCHGIAFRQCSLKTYVKLSFSLCTMFALCLGLFLLIFPGAYDNLKQYFLTQLLPTLTYHRYDSILVGLNKLFIVMATIKQYIFCYLLIMLFFVLYAFKFSLIPCGKLLLKQFCNPITCLFFYIGLTALIPITISPKQSSRFALQACFFFNLAYLSILTAPLEKWVKNISAKYIYLFGLGVLCIGGYFFLSFPAQFEEDLNDHYVTLTKFVSSSNFPVNRYDSEEIVAIIGKETNLLSVPDLVYRTNPSIIGTYLNRRHNIYISPVGFSDYLLITDKFMDYKLYRKEVSTLLLDRSANYQLVRELKIHKLYKRFPLSH